MVLWSCRWNCNPVVAGLIPGFSNLSDETINLGPHLHMTLAVGGMLNPKSTKKKDEILPGVVISPSE